LEDIADQSASLRQSTLRPDLVLIGVSEFLQAKPTADVAAANAREHVTFAEALKRGDVRNILKPLRDNFWFYTRRQDVSLESESLLLGAKVKIVRAMGGRIENPTTDPWREMIHLEAPAHASAATFREQLESYRNRKLFDPATYESPMAREQLDSLIQLVRELQSAGARVVIVLMPEYSELREKIPADALQRMLGGLHDQLGSAAPDVLNFRAALGDDDFSDISHANVEGQADFSRLLAAQIVKFLPNHPPLMSPSAH
jgi:hypothetical protein